MNPIPYSVYRQKDDITYFCDQMNSKCDSLIESNSQCWGLGPYAKNDSIWSSYPLNSNILSLDECSVLSRQQIMLIDQYSRMLGVDHEKINATIDESVLIDIRQNAQEINYQTDRYSHLTSLFFFDNGLIIMDNPLYNADLSFNDKQNPFFRKRIIQKFNKYDIVCLPSNISYKYIIEGKDKKIIKGLIKYI